MFHFRSMQKAASCMFKAVISVLCLPINVNYNPEQQIATCKFMRPAAIGSHAKRRATNHVPHKPTVRSNRGPSLTVEHKSLSGKRYLCPSSADVLRFSNPSGMLQIFPISSQSFQSLPNLFRWVQDKVIFAVHTLHGNFT